MTRLVGPPRLSGVTVTIAVYGYILTVLEKVIQTSAGPLQVATGLQSGAEAAIHAMKEIFDSDETEAIILVDASNTFNLLDRKAALHIARIWL